MEKERSDLIADRRSARLTCSDKISTLLAKSNLDAIEDGGFPRSFDAFECDEHAFNVPYVLDVRSVAAILIAANGTFAPSCR
jgi:hypothetical protein